MMPSAVSEPTTAAATRSSASFIDGWLIWPVTPRLCDRSLGPMNSTSTPSTATRVVDRVDRLGGLDVHDDERLPIRPDDVIGERLGEPQSAAAHPGEAPDAVGLVLDRPNDRLRLLGAS